MGAVTLLENVISMSEKTADKLIRMGNADGTLLYLALLRYGGDLSKAQGALGWSQGRVEGAYEPLRQENLVGPAPEKDTAPLQDRPPEYVTADILLALEQDSGFAGLQRQVERLLGSVMSQTDLKSLYFIYDYLALPAEVILLLTGWCMEETERQYGLGRKPRMSQIKKAAYRWKDQGLTQLSAAEDFLRRQRGLYAREIKLLPRLGISDRKPLDREREYIAVWVDWGFTDDAIVLAYQKTLMKKQTMSWPYMNSILKNWHSKGYKTLKDVEEAEGQRFVRPKKAYGETAGGQSGSLSGPAGGDSRSARNIAALRRAAKQES